MIEIGNVVEVHLNTEAAAFLGIVLDLDNTKSWKKDTWYKVQPLEKKAMPGIFWFRENKVEKIADTPHFLVVDGEQIGE